MKEADDSASETPDGGSVPDERLVKINRAVDQARQRAEAAGRRMRQANQQQVGQSKDGSLRVVKGMPLDRKASDRQASSKRRVGNSCTPRDIGGVVMLDPDLPLPEEECTELSILSQGRGKRIPVGRQIGSAARRSCSFQPQAPGESMTGGVRRGSAIRRSSSENTAGWGYRETKASRLRKQQTAAAGVPGPLGGGTGVADKRSPVVGGGGAGATEKRSPGAGLREAAPVAKGGRARSHQHPPPAPRPGIREAARRTASYSAPQTERSPGMPVNRAAAARGFASRRRASLSAPSAERVVAPRPQTAFGSTLPNRSASQSAPWAPRRIPSATATFAAPPNGGIRASASSVQGVRRRVQTATQIAPTAPQSMAAPTQPSERRRDTSKSVSPQRRRQLSPARGAQDRAKSSGEERHRSRSREGTFARPVSTSPPPSRISPPRRAQSGSPTPQPPPPDADAPPSISAHLVRPRPVGVARTPARSIAPAPAPTPAPA
eukprot:Hpha_TRINITY_DN234_c0_g1::TRINITY_DN234_c0_g1_i1::g.83613::m.83613